MAFIMMVGIAGAGKSTVAATLAAETGAVVISSDAIRGELYGDEAAQGSVVEVFRVMEERTLAALATGKTVIYDATNVVAWRRREFLAKLPEEVEKVCVWVNVSTERALQNNLGRERHVPEWVIHRMAEQLEPPTMEEGWDEITISYRRLTRLVGALCFGTPARTHAVLE